MFNLSDEGVHFERRYCSTSAARGVQLERYIHGGGIGEVNEQMYQNGNKIGCFGGHSDTSKQTQKTKTTQPPEEVITADTTPANGTIKDDMIYIIGFGWVENEGGGGEGTHDHEMKTNGNKIGCFG